MTDHSNDLEQQSVANVGVREAFTTLHYPCVVLKDALFAKRKVLGSLHIEWIKADQVEIVVDKLVQMVREYAAGEQRAISEIERVQQALQRELLHVGELKKLTENYRTSLDRLQREGLALRRKGRELQRQVRSVQRKRPRAQRSGRK